MSPLPSQVIELLEKFPFGPTGMERLSLEECIERMRRHLEKRYSSWSGSLLIELLIDKIEDVEIAFEVNSEEDDIVAGLSSEEETNWKIIFLIHYKFLWVSEDKYFLKEIE